MEWVISENLIRRHLTSQPACCHRPQPAADCWKRMARERQRDGGSLAKKFAKLETNGKASQAAARIAGTNSNYVEVVKTIGKQAPELLDQVRNGIIGVPDAKKLSKLPEADRRGLLARCNGRPLGSGELHGLLNEVRKEQRQQAAREFAQESNDDCGIIVGDLGILQEQLKDAEADIFLTDPPYAEVELYDRLAELAAAKSAPRRALPGLRGAVLLARGHGGDGQAPGVLVDAGDPVFRFPLRHPPAARPEQVAVHRRIREAAPHTGAAMVVRPS